MRILTIHADFIEFQARKKAFKDAEKDVSKDKHKVEECLVVFTAVEKSDEKDPNLIVEKYLSQIRDIANQVKVKNIVLYPYAHLSPNLSNPKTAENVMKKAEKLLKKEYKVWRAPFGWYKSFNISCKGHPLSELSREFTVDEKQKGMQGGKDEAFEFNDRAINKEQKISISAALVAGKAVKNIYPKAEIGSIGTYHEQAYVDILNVSVSKDNLTKIEKEMQKIISKQEKIEKGSKKDLNFLQKEIIKDLGKNAEIYKIGNVSVVPLNKKPFVNSTKEIGAFKITNTSSAYWKNNAANDQLARIYCVAFSSKKKLSDYEKKQENLELRDHKKIGEQLELFAFHETSPGIPYWLPKGLIIYQELVKFWKEEHDKLDYKEIATPLINKKELWEISGHWEHYRKDMFVADMGENEVYGIKAMNCPNSMVIFGMRPRSYRELPLKLSNTDLLHRYELSGTLNGLFRVRAFSQDDAHIFVTEDMIEEQFEEILSIAHKFYEVFGIKYCLRLGTRPEKFMGSKDLWDKAESILKKILKKIKKKHGVDYFVLEGDGAFYGPKIDIVMKDALGRDHQTGTVQLDYQQPRRFDLKYIDKDGKMMTPAVIHRVIYGSLERFIGIIIEHFSGNFPLWISPVQVKIVTVNDSSDKFAKEIMSNLREKGIRAELDARRETISKKVRDAQMQKINYIVTVGDKEVKSKTLAVRHRSGKVKFGVKPGKFAEQLLKEIEKKEIK